MKKSIILFLCLPAAFYFWSCSRTNKTDVAANEEVVFYPQQGHYGNASFAAFSPDGKQVVSLSSNGLILWDVSTGRENIRSSGNKFYEYYDCHKSMTFINEGMQAVFCARGDIVFLDLATGRETRTLSGSGTYASHSAFSPDGKRSVFGYSDGTIELMDVETEKAIRTFVGHSQSVTHLAFSPDAKYFISVSLDRTLKLWDAATGREIRTIAKDNDPLFAATFSPDGKQVISGTFFKLWDVETGKLAKAIRSPWDFRLWGLNSGLMADFVVCSPDGKQFISSSYYDKAFMLWDIAKKKPIETFSGHSGYIRSVMFSPDGKQLISSSDDGTVKLWDVETGKEIVQFISFDDGEWIAITPEGYYNASPNGDKYMNVRVGSDIFAMEQYRQSFYKPALVVQTEPENTSTQQSVQQSTQQDVVQQEIKIPVQQEVRTLLDPDIAPPQVLISSPASGMNTTSAQTSITASVDGKTQNIQYVTVMLNGKLVAQDMGVTPQGVKGLSTIARLSVLADGSVNKKQVQFNLDVPLDSGNNIIEVIASNGYSEARAVVEVFCQAANTSLPDLYILSVGVSQYVDNSIPSLKYAANDAKGIVAAFKAQEGKRYRSVRSLIIADGADREPTSDNIRDGMDFLQGAGQNDIMILFLSGHGGSDDQGNFFFMPLNMAFNQNGTPLRSRIISNGELQDVLHFPGQKLIFIDSCYSGGFTGNQVRSVDNDMLINSLKDDSPVIFTSSSKMEQSWEYDRARLGYFTHALIQGISGAADTNKDGKITIENLGQYVNKTVSGLKDTQHPYYWIPPGYRDLVVAETGR